MTLTPRYTRTITGHLEELLEYPRWFIERDVDFTHCPHYGRFDGSVEACRQCEFGEACLWLNRDRSPSLRAGSLEELVTALQAAVGYVQSRSEHSRDCHCRTCKWLHEARQFLHARTHWK